MEIIFRKDAGDPDKLAALTEEYRTKFANPFIAGHRGYIDDVIMPHETRKRICRSLAMLHEKKVENPWRKHSKSRHETAKEPRPEHVQDNPVRQPRRPAATGRERSCWARSAPRSSREVTIFQDLIAKRGDRPATAASPSCWARGAPAIEREVTMFQSLIASAATAAMGCGLPLARSAQRSSREVTMFARS